MQTSTLRKSALLLITTLAVAAFATAGTIPQWPATEPYSWDTAPFTPVCGVVSIQALDTLQMGSYGTGSKNAWWLPYGSVSGAAWSERLCIAKLINPTNTPLTNIHVKVLDQSGSSGKHAWALILKDSAGRILDFGVRPFYKTAYLMPHEWDGTSWPNYSGNGFFTPYYERPRHGNDYYTMDFTQNGDGTITWILDGYSPTAGQILNVTNTTGVAYGNITEVYLSASTTDTTTQNQKWTEFSVLPQVYSPPPLKIAPAGPTDVTLSWPSPWTTSFLVQTNADLNTTAWGDVTTTPNDDGTTITVTLPIEAGNQFFRLKK
jgi:hypothetical protein